jgi:hypothetical protein
VPACLPQRHHRPGWVLEHGGPARAGHVERLGQHARAQLPRPGGRLVQVIDRDVGAPAGSLVLGVLVDPGDVPAPEPAHRVRALVGWQVLELPAEQPTVEPLGARHVSGAEVDPAEGPTRVALDFAHRDSSRLGG